MQNKHEGQTKLKNVARTLPGFLSCFYVKQRNVDGRRIEPEGTTYKFFVLLERCVTKMAMNDLSNVNESSVETTLYRTAPEEASDGDLRQALYRMAQ